ncbi:abnormal spindle-like microcephaly-associated protein [Heptranchias perlo]|uniref:abnormal spindle-like microcephaly-associated protein n=1 Tax=Heptranchias perlo TaxID=212740 RepID=UPI003559C68E
MDPVISMDVNPTHRPHGGATATSSRSGEDVPVLTLTHFARTPFVCFNTVRIGCSKTETVAIENPESSPVLVAIDKFPASKGFAVHEREFVVEPAEKYHLSITWTPVDAGGVRETVTFNVGCVKVLCILLGKAEDPPKKKRSLWESIKRKRASEGSVLLKPKRSVSIASKTIIISQKMDILKTQGSPSPLQSCENLSPVGERVPPLHHPVDVLEYDSHEVMHLSPIFAPGQIKQELENCTPRSLKRFATYSVLQSNGVSLQIEGRLDNEEKPDESCTAEPCMESGVNLVCQSLKAFSTETPQNISCISASHTPINVRRILSPDSFVNDSYVPDGDPEPIVQPSVLSPDQFLMDALGATNQPLSSLSQEKAVETSSTANSLQSGNSSIQERSNEQLGFAAKLRSPGPVQGTLPVINVKELEPAKSRLTFFVTSKTSNQHQSSQSRRQPVHQSIAQTTNRPVCTATKTKSKSVGQYELERKVKLSRRQFAEVKTSSSSRSVIVVETEAENKIESLAIKSSFICRKRKSSEYLSNDTDEKDIDTNKRKSLNVEQLIRKSNIVKKTTSRRLSGGGKRLQKRKSVSQVIKSSSTAQIKTGKLMPGVALSQFTFRKLTKTVIPRHPMPFAAKNMFYDERWKEKQERGFVWWLNFILTPDDFKVNTESSRVHAATLFLGSETQHHKISVPAAPTKEEMSLKAYTAKCRLNRLRRAACRLFTSEGMVKVIQKLEAAIEAKRLLVRKDRYLWKDFGERQKILKWLLSYNPLWLRIGLESVFGELIPLESNSDVIGLARFILNRLLWNSDIAAEYRHPTVPHLYRDEHQEVLAQFTLKKFLLLVWFLDCAKQSRLIDHDPCLFCKDAEFKMSKDLLLAFSRDFLSGEGDISRHLGYLGLTVSHSQTPLHEFNFAVANIAADLRCGIRLVRAVELLTQNWKLSKQLRVPAISRLQKLHNVDVALNVLKTRGVDLKDEQGNIIDPRDIVDGHRERTLALLWRIIFAFQVEILLNEDQLQEEIEFLQKTLHTWHKLAALRSMSVLSHAAKDQDLKIVPEKYSPRITLLMSWVNAVCAYYGVKVENFTVPFSDGRVLCYLIHHYHPGLLAVDNIYQRTTQTVECAQHGTVAIDTSTSDSDESSVDVMPTNLNSPSATLYEELLENEKNNFNLVTTAVAELGGVPAMIRHVDMSNTIPDEKVVITYISFLCARLLDLRKEARAARIIQAAWRKYKLNYELQLLQEKDRAACVIQAAVRRFLHQQHVKKKINASIIIQTLWRGHVARRKTKALVMKKVQVVQNEAATLIQAYWRGYAGRRQFQRARHYCILIQSHIRMKIAVTSYRHTVWATVTLQRHFRAHRLALAERRDYLKLKLSAVMIQSAFRWWKACKLEKQTKAAIVVQKYIRGFLCRYQYKSFQRSISLIQAYAKGYLVRTEMSKRRNAAITLQKYIKAYVTGKHEYVSYQRLKWAAVVIQAAYRGLKVRKLYCQTKSAIVIQSTFRMYLQRKRFIAIRKVVVTMQTLVRMQLAQIRFLKYRQAAITLQRRFRAKQQGRKQMQHYLALRQAAVKMQVAFRRWRAQKEIRENQAAITIQSWYRMYIEKQKYLHQKESCIQIQSWYRCYMAQRAFRTMKTAMLIIQKYYRAYREGKAQREKHLLMLKAAITIQAYFRGMLARQLARKVKAACIIQSYWQMRKERFKFLHYKQCIVALQAHVRRWQTQQRYHSMKIAACTLQARFRAISAQKKAQSEYKALRSAAVVLQSAYRGLQARRQFCMLRSVVKIQSTFRASVARKRFIQIKNATIKIQASVKMIQVQKYYRSLQKTTTYVQRRYRANKLCLEKRKEYLKKREACIRLQSAVRLYLIQKQLHLWRQAAVKIQSTFRMHRLRSQYLRIRYAAVIIQRGFRAYNKGIYQRQNFLRIKEAVICLQAVYKSYSVRKMIQLQHKAAIKIQAAFRGHASRVKYLAMQNVAIAIQRWYRNCKVGQQQRLKYLKIRAAAIILQAVCRGFSAREKFKMQHKAAVIVQTAFRRFRAQHQFRVLKNVVVTVQCRYKAKLMGRKQHQAYLTMCQSATTLQAAYKGMIARKEFRRKRQACIAIQSYFRMHKMHAKFKTRRLATLIIQNRFRAHVQRKCQEQNYQKMRTAAIVLQAAFRAMKTRKKLKEIHKAATVIQAMVKSYSAKKRYTSLKAASILLQRQYRALVLTRKQREIYLSVHNATLSIQAAYRGMKVRRDIRCKHKAAAVIQAAFRMRKVCLPYRAMRLAAMIIQNHYRAHLKRRIDRDNYMKIRNSVLLIQAAYRGMGVRKHVRSMHKSATLIQTYYRMHKQCQCYRRLRWAATQVQRRYRACKIRDAHVKQYNDVKKATVRIQAVFRGMKTRQEIQRIGQAAIIIQRRFRAYNDRKKYLSLRAAATIIQQRYRALVLSRIHQQQYCSVRNATLIIQAAYRGLKVRRELHCKHKAAAVIQAAFRMHKVCLPYRAMRLAAMIIQSHYRAHLKRKTDRDNYMKIRNSVLLIQAAYRGMSVRKHMRSMHKSATLIQTYYRMHKQCQCYRRLCWAAAVVQRRYRACKIRDAHVKQYNDVKKATVRIQAVFRGMKTRLEIQRIGQAAIIIQRRFRAYNDRKKYLSLRAAATIIQQRYRALVLSRIHQQQYCSVRNATLSIQAAYRGMKVRREIHRKHKAAVVIQAAFRMHKVCLPYRAMRLAATIIQRHFRAHLKRKTDRDNYMRIRNSALLIQAAYRGMSVRKHMRSMHKSATLIQTYYRMHKQCQCYRRLCWAAAVVQRRYRACKIRDAHVKQYNDVKKATVRIQAVFRGMKTRLEIQRIGQAAIIIQRRFRAYNDRKKYLSLRAAATIIQQRYRALVLSRIHQQQYCSVRNATLSIQAAYRGMKVRREIHRKHKAAVVIQAAFRMHKVCLPYRAMRLAATIIQRHFRAHLKRKTDRDNYMRIRNSALLIQAAYRGMSVRKHVRSMHKSATLIQTYYRMHKQCQCYRRLRWAATQVQRRYRACKIRDAHVKQYNDVKKATVRIQAVFRGMKTRQEIQRIGQAAVIIQRRFRAYNDRKKYLSLRAAATIIQQRYRALVLSRIHQQQYCSVRNATLSIQAAYRGMKVRRELHCKHKAAAVIQAAFRMHKVCLPYRAMRLAATIIQSHYRAHLKRKTDRDNYMRIRNSVLLIQAAYRGMCVRKHLRSMHKSATLIQTYYRMHKQCQCYRRLRWAATQVQRRYQACKIRDAHVKQYNDVKKATISFQAFYRGKKVRDLVKKIKAARRIKSFLQMCITRKLFLNQKSAAVRLQAAFRGYRARVRYRAMWLAAVSIQIWYRACKMGRSQLVKYQSMRHAAITIQAAYKGMVVRQWVKQKHAAVKIQSVLRMILYRRAFLRIKSAAIVMQSCYRAYEARKLYRTYKAAAVVLQGRYRSYLLMKQQRSAYLTFQQTIITLQARIRGFIAQRSYKKLQQSTTKIQACYRRKKQRQRFLVYKKATCVIQQHYRAYCQRKVEQQKYFQMKHAAVIIQTTFRRHQARQLVKKMRAAQKIQAWFKAQVVRRQYKSILNSVIFIQGQLRAKQERFRFLKIRAATIVIQQRWRMSIATRRLQHENLRKTMAAIKIQAIWKGLKTRKQMIKKHEAASQIQLMYRGYNQRKKFLQQRSAALVIQGLYRAWQLAKTENMKYKKTRKAVILLQAVCRGWLVRKKHAEQKLAEKKLRFTAAVYYHLCAIKIQRTYRGYVALKLAKGTINSVICIQRWFRTCLQRRRYLDQRQKIVVAQRTVKVWLMQRHRAAVVIQKAVRRFIFQTRKKRFYCGIIKIQALWKGYCLRKKTNNLQVTAIRRRIQQANQNSTEEQKLCNRTAVALDYILKYKHFSYILAALQHLEVATRLSSICCENLAQSGATPIILILIRSCNRSVPSMDVIKSAVQVLLNLSKYEKTSAVVYEVDNSINTLLDLLHMYRGKAGDKTSDKCGSIFTKVCCLLAILSRDSQKAREVRSLPRAMDRIRSIYELTVRKHKMDTDRINVKQRMNVPRNGVLYIPATPVRTRVVSKLNPDWVLRRDNMKEIVDPLKAIQLVVDTLGISP